MIFFKDIPSNPEAMRNLQADLKRQMPPGGEHYTDEQLADLIERGAALALATLRGMDDHLREATRGLDDEDCTVVQSVALMQIAGTAKQTLSALLMESFVNMIFGRRRD